jgi:C4-dicarboxylate transporter DctM subunit
MNLVMFGLGMFLEIISTILITAPIVLPLLAPLGINPIHYGIVVIVNMELAALTPPVGLNLYVMKSISKLRLVEVLRGFLPFVLLLAILLVLVTLIPALSLWLPSLW